jgi:hypothetical protein
MVLYTKISNLCSSSTPAITSNEKFLRPLDAVYWKDWTPVYKLDGNKTHKDYSKSLYPYPKRIIYINK